MKKQMVNLSSKSHSTKKDERGLMVCGTTLKNISSLFNYLMRNLGLIGDTLVKGFSIDLQSLCQITTGIITDEQ